MHADSLAPRRRKLRTDPRNLAPEKTPENPGVSGGMFRKAEKSGLVRRRENNHANTR